MLRIIFECGGWVYGIINHDKSSPLTFFNEGFHYSSLSGYTLFPSQGSHYIDHKPSFHGGSRNHFYNSGGVLFFEHAGMIEDFQKDSISYSRE